MTPQRALIEAAEEAKQILSDAGNSSFTDSIIEAMNILEAAISSAKAAEEGVETMYRLEWYSDVHKIWIPDAYLRRDKTFIEQRMDECEPGTTKLRMVQRDTYSTVLSVREKEVL
jgi:hypothetical protein